MKELDDIGQFDPTVRKEQNADTSVQDCAEKSRIATVLQQISGTSGLTTANTEKALHLLGNGVSAEATAAALGVTASRISQLMAEDMFSDLVSELRYKTLKKNNDRDDAYGSLEDKLLAKLNRALPLLIKPESILKAVQIVNGAKRRGQQAPQQASTQQLVVSLTLPNVIANKFSVDMNNQVVRAGEQELLTMPSGNLLERVEKLQEAATTKEVPHVPDQGTES